MSCRMPNADYDIQRDPELRCASTDAEKDGHTHHCRRTTHADGAHICICNHLWGPKAAA